jgi:hypothetical protein
MTEMRNEGVSRPEWMDSFRAPYPNLGQHSETGTVQVWPEKQIRSVPVPDDVLVQELKTSRHSDNRRVLFFVPPTPRQIMLDVISVADNGRGNL